MNTTAIIFFVFGALVLWGGFATTLYKSLNNKSENE